MMLVGLYTTARLTVSGIKTAKKMYSNGAKVNFILDMRNEVFDEEKTKLKEINADWKFVSNEENILY